MMSRAGVILDPGPFSDGTSSVRSGDENSVQRSFQGGGHTEELLEHHQARAQAQLAEKFSELKHWQDVQKDELVQQQQQRMAILRAQQEQLQRALAQQRSRQWGGANQANPSTPPTVSRETRSPVMLETAPPSGPGQASLLQRYDSHSLGTLLQRAQDDILQEEEEEEGSDLEDAGSVEEDGFYPLPDSTSELSDVETPTKPGHKQYYQSTPTQERVSSPGDISTQIPPQMSPLREETRQGSEAEDPPSTDGNPQASPSPEPAGFDDIPVNPRTRAKTFDELLEEKLRSESVVETVPAPTNSVKPKRTYLKKGAGLARFGNLKAPSLRSTKPKSLELEKKIPASGRAERDEQGKEERMSSEQSPVDNTRKPQAQYATAGDPFKRPIGRAPVSIIREKLSSQSGIRHFTGGVSPSTIEASNDASPVDVKSVSMFQAEKKKQFDEESLAEFEMLEQAAEDNASFSSENSLVVGVMKRAKLRAKILATSPYGGRGLPTLVSVDTVDDGEDKSHGASDDRMGPGLSAQSHDSVHNISSDSDEEDHDSELNATLKHEGGRRISSLTKRKVTRGRSIDVARGSVDDQTGDRSRGGSDFRSEERKSGHYRSHGNSEEAEGDSNEDSNSSIEGLVTVIPNRLKSRLARVAGDYPPDGRESGLRDDSRGRLDGNLVSEPRASVQNRYSSGKSSGSYHDNGVYGESDSDSGMRHGASTQQRYQNGPREDSEGYRGGSLDGSSENKLGTDHVAGAWNRRPSREEGREDEHGNKHPIGGYATRVSGRDGWRSHEGQRNGNQSNNLNMGRTGGQLGKPDNPRINAVPMDSEDSEDDSSTEGEGEEDRKSKKDQPGSAGYEFEDDETWGDFSVNLSNSSSDSIVVEPAVTSDKTGKGRSRSVLDDVNGPKPSGEQERMTPPPSHLVAKLFPQLKQREKPKTDQIAENALAASKDRPIGDGLQAKVFKEKLTQLENEIDRFRKENAALSKLREEREKGLEAFKKEVAEFERQKEAELKQIEEYREKEMKKLRKEKKIFEKHQKTVRSLPDKKDRDEIDKLKGQLTELQEELARREARWSANTRRMKARVDGLTDENKQLQDEMEAMRAKQGEELAKTERKKAASRIKALRDASRPKSLIPEVIPGSFPPLPSNLPSHPEMESANPQSKSKAKSKSHRDNPKEEERDISDSDSSGDDSTPTLSVAPGRQTKYPIPHSPGVRGSPQEKPERDMSGSEEQIHHPDGKVEVVQSDGSRLITFKNGTRKEISSDGQTITVTFFNGDTRQIYPDQRVVYYYAETKIAHTTYEDGLEIIHFPNNQTEKHYPDGTKEITFPDQTIKYLFQNGGEECVFPDGTVLRVDKSGDRTMEFPNGQREIHTSQYKKREYPDGTVKTIYPDGRQETRYAHGRLRVKDKDGRVLVDQQT